MGEISIDLKILSTINASLRNALETNVLRPALYYRLAVVVIHIPSLTDRKNDLGLLTNHYHSYDCYMATIPGDLERKFEWTFCESI